MLQEQYKTFTAVQGNIRMNMTKILLSNVSLKMASVTLASTSSIHHQFQVVLSFFHLWRIPSKAEILKVMEVITIAFFYNALFPFKDIYIDQVI